MHEKKTIVISATHSNSIIDLSTITGINQHILLMIESYVNATVYDTKPLSNLEIHIGAHAHISWISLVAHASITINSGESSKFIGTQILAHYSNCCQKLTTISLSKSSTIHWTMFPFLPKRSKYLLTSHQVHSADNTTSVVRIMGHARQNACFHYHGMITIEKNLAAVTVHQHSSLILSGTNIQTYMLPCFNIQSPDVTCTHGAACGQLDKQQIEYLCARGIDKDNSKKIILKARQQAAIDQSLPETVKCQIEDFLDKVF